ncbi:MAG: N-acetyl-gamma-glutamyl-phosphate reductase, partial [Parasporobacterium sp.]|nr:N-acetyl-gamma-glutamyl-phosphate reductase [Parasporobacterium sp.]
ESQPDFLDSPRLYGLTQSHKHLPEMQKICGLAKEPVFCPIVADYYSGMEVVVMLTPDQLNVTENPMEAIKQVYRSYYEKGLVRFEDGVDADGFAASNALTGRDDLVITVQGNDQRITLISRFDNLGKGASGAAIQNMNIVLGVDEAEGLVL